MDESSSSDEEYGENERILLEELKENQSKYKKSKQRTVYDFDDEEDDEGEEAGEPDGEEDEASDIDMGSDLEDNKDYMPDDRAWGKRRKNFYNTDFDKDYSGSYGADDAEIAEMEEQEARSIQKRLMEQLTDADFTLTDIVENITHEPEEKSEVIQSDLTRLSKRQKLELFRKESPEFAVLVDDFEAKMTEAREKVIPILDWIKNGKLKPSLAGDFLETKYRIILNYCTNVVFYILLKTKKIPVKDHPVLKTLFRYRQLLQQIEDVDEKIIKPQVEQLIKIFNTGDTDDQQKKKRTKLLKIFNKTSEPQKEPSSTPAVTEPITAPDSQDDSEDGTEEVMEEDTKRAITYQMAKNKGLTPKRSKEQRNPRVKHRNKFRKSLIRRRGQVRTPRAEIPVYAGEPTGIKIGLKKGRKLS